MTEEIPPDEINYAPKKGMDFGFPYCFGKGTPDVETNLNGTINCKEKYTGASRELDPHVAALGVRFYKTTGEKHFPKDKYNTNTFFVCEHGSWNRKFPLGYRVMLASLGEDRKTVKSYEEFMAGFIQDQGVIKGRPVDVIVAKDGSLLVSDDHAHKIYRISYDG